MFRVQGLQADVTGESEAGMEIVLGEDEPDIPAAG